MRLVPNLLPAILITLIAQFSCYADTRPQIIGTSAPVFLLPDSNGKLHSLKRWNNKLIIVNFWATWCAPCKKEIPLFNDIQREFDDEIQFVGIAIDNAKDVKIFNKNIPLNYPNLIGGLDAIELVQQYGNKTGTLPYTVFINRTGKILMTASGKVTRRFLQRTIEKLL